MKIADYTLSIVLDVQGERVELAMPRDTEMRDKVNRFCIGHRGWEHETVMSSLLGRIVDTIPQPLMLDLGAFVGYYTILGSKLIGRRGRVVGIESNLRHVEFLRQMIALNGLDNAEVIHTALSDRSESLRSTRQLVSTNLDGDGAVMQAETCDAMCERLGLRPNIAKLDVHGFEGKVLHGMRGVLRNSIEFLLMELHDSEFVHMYTPDISRLDVLDCFDAAGFRTYHVAGLSCKPTKAQLFVDEEGRYAYYQLTRENREHLLFDRHSKILILASKRPLEDVIGPSMVDPGLRAASELACAPVPER